MWAWCRWWTGSGASRRRSSASSRSKSAAGERRGKNPASVGSGAGNDDGDEHHLNPFLPEAPSASSKVQCRNVASRAWWVEEAGAAEVVESKGKLWLTTGITRGGKLFYNIEEIGFLVEIGALILLNENDETIGREGIYGKIVGEKYGCSWDVFRAYKHLKSLGYIVGRYDIPWTVKNSGTCDTTIPPTSVLHTDQSFNRAGISPSFEVYLPNSKFKKSAPGAPSFLLCLLRNKPPSRVELENVETNFGGIPLKYCHVDNGRVSFLSFDKVTLPSLP
ncbi:unnamed protein product [Urochloa humidicola]